jgi:cobalamin biosynthesis Mg chelatase CobN
MLGRRRITTSTPLRSSIADAAFAVEERVVWGAADALRRIADVVKWPFERAIWAIERGVVWPLEKRTGDWDGSIRAAGVAALALCAVGAGVFGLVWASGSGGGAAPHTQQASAPVVAPAVTQAPKQQPAQAAPVLHGATPDFTPKASAGAAGAGNAAAAKAPAEATAANEGATADATSSPAGSTTTATKVVPVGPAATKVARQFSGAFVVEPAGEEVASAVAPSSSMRPAAPIPRSALRLPQRRRRSSLTPSCSGRRAFPPTSRCRRPRC